jgi:hypothetical protein
MPILWTLNMDIMGIMDSPRTVGIMDTVIWALSTLYGHYGHYMGIMDTNMGIMDIF